ncbi:MAG: hypothetical protein QM737_18680 [Ferruginibacter sp.]
MNKILLIIFFLTTVSYSFPQRPDTGGIDHVIDTAISDSPFVFLSHRQLMHRLDSLQKRVDSLSISKIKDNKTTLMDIYNNVLAPLFVALVIGIFSWLWAKRKQQEKIDAAPRKYVEALEKLIITGVSEGEEKAILNARAIVSTRDSLRNSLGAISSSLNSEIDRLAEEIGQTYYTPKGPMIRQENPDMNSKQAYNTIIVLSKIWPARKDEIEVEIRKLLAILGLSQMSIPKN